MRRVFNWMVFFGIMLFAGGIAIVTLIVYNNLPSPFDIANATGKSDISYYTIFLESPASRNDILNANLPFTPIITNGNNAPMNSSENSFIPKATPVAASTVILDINNTNVSANEASDIPSTLPAITPTVSADDNLASESVYEGSEIQNASPAIAPTVVSVESNPPADANLLPDPSPAAGPVSISSESNSVPSVPQSQPVGLIPDRLVIPVINLDASIIPVDYKKIEVGDQVYYQWLTPEQFAVGWHASSAFLGQPGNIVLNGHHNAYGMVFKDLVTLRIGDAISVYSGFQEFRYQVVANMLLPEEFETVSTRMENALWIGPSTDERLTLVTCWPADSNTHRVIIVAKPVGNSSFTSVP